MIHGAQHTPHCPVTGVHHEHPVPARGRPCASLPGAQPLPGTEYRSMIIRAGEGISASIRAGAAPARPGKRERGAARRSVSGQATGQTTATARCV